MIFENTIIPEIIILLILSIIFGFFIFRKRLNDLKKIKEFTEKRNEIQFKIYRMFTKKENEILLFGLEEILKLTDSKDGFFHFYQSENDEIQLSFYSQKTYEICKTNKDLLYPLKSAGIWADAIRKKKPIIVNDYNNYKNKKGYPEGHVSIKKFISCPIIEDDKVVAITGIANSSKDYTQKEVDDLQIIMNETYNLIKRKEGIKNLELITEEKSKIERELLIYQKTESIGNLASGIAHDLNNILTPILGYSELIQNNPTVSAEIKSHINHIVNSSNRAKELVKQILTFGKQKDFLIHPIKISRIIRDLINLIRITVPSNIVLNYNINDCGYILADEVYIHQIVINLCVNAIQSIEGSGNVYIELIEENKYAKLTIKDTGEGISKENINKIFNPYFTTKGPKKGNGLGLSVIKGLITMLKGRIEVESEIGKGTKFTTFFPICIFKSEGIEPKEVDNFEIKGNKRKIIIVDDEELILLVLSNILENSDFKIHKFKDGKEALIYCKENNFDLLITDLTMSSLNGIELSTEIKKIKPKSKILLISGYGDSFNLESTKNYIDGFLSKPINRNELIFAIKKILDKD